MSLERLKARRPWAAAAPLAASLLVFPVVALASDVIDLRLSQFAINLNPAFIADADSRRIASALHLGLVAVDQDGELLPRIASEWERTADDEFRFELVDGITFSNGEAITAEIVVDSLCRSMQPGRPFAWVLDRVPQEIVEDGERVDCLGLHVDEQGRVVIEWNGPEDWLFESLASPAGWIVPVEEEDAPYGVVAGAGPWQVEEIVADSRVVLVSRDGGPIEAGAGQMVFHYVPDDSVAATRFRQGSLDVLEIGTPQLAALLVTPGTSDLREGVSGIVERRRTEQIRLVIVNEERLVSQYGFSPEQAREFTRMYGGAVNRERLRQLAGTLAVPLHTAFPVVESPDVTEPTAASVQFPSVAVRLLTENDPFSDLIAANLPGRLDGVTVRYQGLERGLLINNLVTGAFTLASIALEPLTTDPRYWTSFFRPGSPFTVLGKPLDVVAQIDLTEPDALAQLDAIINDEGNWIPLLREHRLILQSPAIGGLRFTRTGLVSYESIHIGS